MSEIGPDGYENGESDGRRSFKAEVVEQFSILEIWSFEMDRIMHRTNSDDGPVIE